MHSSKLKKISVALCMALLPVSVFAAGLGKLNVQSGIGEPLKADIELISVSPDELSSITAVIASEEAYAAQGIERPASHNSIKVSVAKNSSGTPVLKLNSAQPISEPFLDMLLQVDWNSGRLLREYTVLLDPPGYTGEADANPEPVSTTQAPVVKPSKSAVADSGAVPDAAVETIKRARKHHVKVAPAVESETSSSSTNVTGQEYLTQKGDTLAKIARDMKPEGVSLDQMLVGLYQANPDAFNGANMNRLNVGKILRQPTADELNAISSKDAKKEIKVQTADWNAYRNKLGGMVADSTPAPDSEASTQSSGGKIKTATEDKSMPATTGPKDVVKLSSGDNKIDVAETKALQAKVTALQEEAVAREKSLKDAQDRTAALEKQIADMQKLIAMKSNAMSDAQKQAETQAVTAEAQPKPVEPPKPAEVKPAEDDVPQAESPKPEVKVEQKPVPVPAPVAVPAEEPSFFAGMLDGTDPVVLGGVGGLLALLGGGWMFLRNKRKKNLADFEQGIMTSGGLKANTVFGNTSSSSVDTGDTSFLTDFSQSAHGGMIDTNDVDPIAEAEVYMAYGRDAQAEEILKDAITKEPKRYELHLKLLEMYAASKNMSAFETVSGELYTTLGADDPTWAKVAEIGSKLEPNNPLYQVSSSLTAAVPEDKSKLDASDFSDSPLADEKDLDMSFGGDTVPNMAISGIGASSESMPDLGMGESGDFDDAFTGDDLDMEPEAEQTPSLAESPMMDSEKVDTGLDFSMGDLEATPDEPRLAESAGFSHTMPDLDFPKFESDESSSFASDSAFSVDTTPALKAEDELSMDVAEPASANFGFDITTIAADTTYNEDAKPLDLSGISLEMGDESPAVEAPLEALAAPELTADEPVEVETKLELVAAYIEMDDKEGARELLEEVIKEGGASQRKRAESLLTQIS